MENPNQVLIFLVNNPDFFLSHRLSIAMAAQKNGFEVHVAAPATGNVAAVKSSGFDFHTIRMDRSRGIPWRELLTLWDIIFLYHRLRPKLVHHITIKPVLYGTVAARIARVPSVINAVSGLGYAFIGKGWKASFLRIIVPIAYRAFLRHPRQRVIFQNPDDAAVFLSHRILRPGESVLIRGSGVDTEKFRPRPESPGPLRVVLVSRMLWDKGVGEFVGAANMLREQGVKARFTLVGEPDPGNPASIPTQVLEKWHREDAVEWWGFRRDMETVLALSHVACLPSYREGLPKSLIEAAAAGKPIVTTDVPGCRDTVDPGHSGLLVPPRNIIALADALRILIQDVKMRLRMGEAGRNFAINRFSQDLVIKEHMSLYRSLI